MQSPSCSLVSLLVFLCDPLWLRVSRSAFSVLEIGPWIRALRRTRLERAFLGKRVPRQPRTLSALSHFDPDGRRIGRGDAGGPQHGILTEHFAVDLSDEVVLAVGVAAPHLPELDGVHSHDRILAVKGLLSAYPFNPSPSIGRAVTEGQSMWTAGVRLPVGCGGPRLKSNRESKNCCFFCSAKIWPSCPVAQLPADPLAPDVKIVWRGRPRP